MTVRQDSKRPAILGMGVDTTSYEEACALILQWGANRESRMACFANVHMTMEAHDSRDFMRVLNQSDLVTPDGMPLVWTLRRMGYRQQERVYGPILTLKLLEKVKHQPIPLGFYGSTPEILQKLIANINREYPQIEIAYAYAPPFRPLTEEEDQTVIQSINASGARVLFVALGCPKQEIWMHNHIGQVQSVMLGVGAAFEFIAGTKKQAPAWIQKIGMEWFFRLMIEPRRLWRRYLFHNPRFVVAVIKQLSQGQYVRK
jgi:N-acetylglucosaminyldiphosphoundecaprenol N-acetyl-beta-D-mannosaminyltransferase